MVDGQVRSTYKGEFQNDVRHGFGTVTWSSGGRYDGYFKDNLRDGEGKMIYNDGTTYEG